MAEDDDQDSKTEQPTSRKLGKAREHGDVIQSMEARTAGMLIGMLAVVWLVAPYMARWMRAYLAGLLDHLHEVRADTLENLKILLGDIMIHMLEWLAIPLGLILLFGLVSSISQTGFLFVAERLLPDLNKLNPWEGIKRLFSMRSLMEFLKSIGKLVIVGVGCYFLLRPRLGDLEQLMTLEQLGILGYAHGVVVRLLAAVLLMMVVISAVDWFWQRYSFIEKMKMTKQEVKEEHKDTEGDPMIKSRIRSLRMQRARQRMMAAVPKANVVVTNPTHYACALKYEMGAMAAPVLVAKGVDFLALRIRELAEKNDVPIIENPPLARALYATVEIDREIPPEHYKAVAEVISYVFRLKERRGN